MLRLIAIEQTDVTNRTELFYNLSMQTRCPYPQCALVFNAPPARMCNCPDCGRLITVRPLDVIYELDRRFEFCERGARPKDIDTRQMHLTALVDDVRSLWNVGSIFRSADGAGFDCLFLTGITGTPPRKEIAKTSLGAEDHVNWHYCLSAAELIATLKQQGFLIVGLEFIAENDGSIPHSMPLTAALNSNKLTAPLLLCVGNEVAGLSGETLSLCDILCHLPMRGFKESLNVAVAFGIAAYQIAEQLQ